MQEKIIIIPWDERNINKYLGTKFFDPKFPLVMVSPPKDETKEEHFYTDSNNFSLIYQYLLRTAEHFRNKKFSAILLEKHFAYTNFDESDKLVEEKNSFRLLKNELDDIYNEEYKKITNRRFFFCLADPMFDLKNPILRILIVAETDMDSLQSQIFFEPNPLAAFKARYASDRIVRMSFFPLFPYETLTKTNDPDILKKILFFMIRSRPFRFGRMALSHPRNFPGCFWSDFAKNYRPIGETDSEFEESVMSPYVDINKNWPEGSKGYSSDLEVDSTFELNYEEI